VGVLHLDKISPRRAIAAWLGVGERELLDVPDWVIDAIATRLSHPDHVTALRDELLDLLQESLTELRYLARTDPLTRLANRHAVEERLANEVSRARRHGRELAVLLLDVDNLKKVNDELGHPAGDDLLREVGHRLGHVVRVSDLPGRWGGDEFIVVCPETDGDAAASLAAKLQHTIADRPVRLSGRILPVTVSVGWAVHSGSGDASSLFAAADASLYAAKYKSRSHHGPLAPIHVVGRLQMSEPAPTTIEPE